MAINYIRSNAITVFPAAKRVGYEESKRTTEDNLLKLNRLSSNAENLNQVFEDPDDNAYIIFSIYGYYFRCLKTDIPTTSNLKAYIKLENDPADDIGWRLASTDVEGGALDGSEDSEGSYFKGLAFTNGDIPSDEESSEGIIGKYYGLSVTDEEGNLILQELKIDSTEIRNGTANESIAEQFTTKALNVDGNVIINTSATTGTIFDVQADSVSKMRVIAPTGAVEIDTWLNVPSVYAITGQNDASVNLTENGTTIERNVTDDMQPTLIINKKQGIGNIFKVDYNSDEQFSVKYNGMTWVKGSIYAPALLNQVLASNAGVYVQDSGTVINRDVADDNPALTVTQSNAGSTGNIAQFKSGETSKVIISKDGNVGVGVNNPTEKLEVGGNIVATGIIGAAGNIVTDGDGNIYANALSSNGSGNSAKIDLNLIWGVTISNEDAVGNYTTLTVNKIAGTGNIIEATYGFEGEQEIKFYVDKDGNVNANNYYGNNITALSGNTYSSINLNNDGTVISRDRNDTKPALTVNKVSGTGNIIEVAYGGDPNFSIDVDGNVNAAGDISSGGTYSGAYITALNNSGGSDSASISLDNAGILLNRNISDSYPTLHVNSNLGTGDIINVTYMNFSRFSIDKDGDVTVDSISNTGNIFDVKHNNISKFAVDVDGAITVGSNTFTTADVTTVKKVIDNIGVSVPTYVGVSGGSIHSDYSSCIKQPVTNTYGAYAVTYTGRITLTNANSVAQFNLPEYITRPNIQVSIVRSAAYGSNYIADIAHGSITVSTSGSASEKRAITVYIGHSAYMTTQISKTIDFCITGIQWINAF